MRNVAWAHHAPAATPSRAAPAAPADSDGDCGEVGAGVTVAGAADSGPAPADYDRMFREVRGFREAAQAGGMDRETRLDGAARIVASWGINEEGSADCD